MNQQDQSPSPRAGYLPPSSLDLDDLLHEIRTRAEGASRSQERLSALLDAVVAISSDLEMSVVLRQVVEAACTLLGARYGAMGVIDSAGGQLVEFIPHGMDGADIREIGHPPRGLGVLGLLLEDPRPLRIDRIADHPEAVGMPAGHPPMSSFIGVPIRVRDMVFGNLYLTDKLDGGSFTEDDESVLEALAAAAGIAIDNAVLYRRARKAEEWSEAVGDLTQTLLEGRNERTALARMAKRARDLSGAQLCALLVHDPEGGLLVQALDMDGDGAALRGEVLTDLRWGIVIESRTPVMLKVEPDDRGGGELSDQLRLPVGLPRAGTTSLVPIAVGDVEVGLIAVSWGEDAPSDLLDTITLLTTFANRMGLVIEAGRAQRSRSHTALLEDRDRIARDMHDHVIQRLFAAGLTLQAVGRHTEGKVSGRIDFVVDELDRAVKDIRSAIFELHHGFPEGGLGPELEAVLERAGAAFGFVPDVVFEGRLADIPDELVPDVVAVVREALSNVAKHSQATDAQVRVVRGDDLVVTIMDNGIGLPEDVGRRSGLANLAGRAARHGGTFEAATLDPRGTILRWSVPLTSDGATIGDEDEGGPV